MPRRRTSATVLPLRKPEAGDLFFEIDRWETVLNLVKDEVEKTIQRLNTKTVHARPDSGPPLFENHEHSQFGLQAARLHT